MTTRFTGKTVLITGAARGIGAALAQRLHTAGANLALVGLEPDLLRMVAKDLGDRVFVYDADVTDLAAMTAAADAAAGEFGGIDAAVANAGIAFIGPLADSPVEHVERTLEVNLMGVWRTDRAVIPHLRRSKGYLLNVTSLAAAGHLPLMGAYTASKAGAEALTDALRIELRPEGVAVGCAYFGVIDTDMTRSAVSTAAGAKGLQLAPPAMDFVARSVPVDDAAKALADGIARRADRVWAPRYVGPALYGRGFLQPAMEFGLRMRPGNLLQALRMAKDADALSNQDPTLGISRPTD